MEKIVAERSTLYKSREWGCNYQCNIQRCLKQFSVKNLHFAYIFIKNYEINLT